MSDLTSISELKRLKGHTDQIYSAVFDRDGVRVATASYDQEREALDGGCPPWLDLRSGFRPKNGERLVTASADGTARIWSFHEGRLALLNTLMHGAEVRLAVFSPDGKQIATAGKDSIVKLWNADTGELLRTLEGTRIWSAVSRSATTGHASQRPAMTARRAFGTCSLANRSVFSRTVAQK